MALETCFRAWALHAAPAGSKDRLLVCSSGGNLVLPSKRVAAAPLSVGRVATRRARHVCQSKNAVDEVLVADEKNWDGMVMACETPVLVEFWAPWCGPCRMIAPVIDELAKDYAGKIMCCKVNTDDSPNVASTYGIRSIPTVLIFKGGEKKESVIGAVPKSTLTTLIDKYIGSSS
ncbi:Thioredoxin M-type, chloroplastic [Zea mays]|uniref:Thioredoxin M-type, chloroplastic n=3 Tax=Zea mays TaxID=4577 RepID=K7TXW7_MAIZE|nr:thioredoxin M-type, chloroplastic-like [Zea mays]AQK39849.1 Thioredoxin M-type, chloroplastic [Zea mays]PWZ46270.1 Thioredoxin M-type, chloroplastic [Zea mays]|eukprot:XP_008662565.1 thioredoxin M-type, chloroplastic-like [Zea mays]